MRPRRHARAAEEQDAEKAGLEEERHQPFVRQQRSDDIRGHVRETAPVGPELERHHDARDHTHAEGNGEELEPELGQPQVDRAAGEEVQALEDRDIRRQPHREGRQEDVQGDHPDELEARQQHRIEGH